MKTAVTYSYTFNPAAKTIDFASFPTFDIKKLYAVVNITANQLIYAVGQSKFGYSSLTGTVLTLNYNTAAMNASDKLMILYDDLAAQTYSVAGSVTSATDLITSLDVSKYTHVVFQLTGTWVGNVIVQYSNDNVNWYQGLISTVGNAATTPGLIVSSNGIFITPVEAKYFRLTASSYTSGTISHNTFFGDSPWHTLNTTTVSSFQNGNWNVNPGVPTFQSSTAALAANATWTSSTMDTIDGRSFSSFSIFSTTTMTVFVDESSDGTNWAVIDDYVVSAGSGQYSSHKISARYARVRVVNGTSANAGGIANLAIYVAQTAVGSEDETRIVDSLGNPINSVNSAGLYNLAVALGATNYAASTVNSSTTQLAAGATFTGTIENTFNQQSYSILVNSDQTGILTINQYIDAAGLFKVSSLSYAISPTAEFCRSGVLNGNYVNMVFQNTGASTTTTFNLNTAYGTIPAATQLNNAPSAINEVNGLPISLGQATAANSFPVVIASNQPTLPIAFGDSVKATYSASITGLASAVAATDIFRITGSATKTVKIRKIGFSGLSSVQIDTAVLLVKRSTANTGGTSTTPTSVSNDSTNAAATVTINAYTANPTLGTIVGNIRSHKISFRVSGTGTSVSTTSSPFEHIFGVAGEQPITLRGTAEQLSVNLNGVTVTGANIDIYVEWTEE